MALGVEEASEAYERAMRNVAPPGPGVCRICRRFNDPKYDICFQCGHQPEVLDAVVPITYSEHLGQMHTALRNYKDGASPGVRRHAAVRLAAILWRFLGEHEGCVARAAEVDGFEIVTTVPSSKPVRDQASPLREMVGWIEPVRSRLSRALEPTGEVEGRQFDARRFRSTADLAGQAVLLLDDTWTSGGHAGSAAQVLLEAGAAKVALVVIGRHIRRDYEPVKDSGKTCGALLDALPEEFDWETCAVHEAASP